MKMRRTKDVTKAQAIAALRALGWTVEPEGRFSVWATDSSGRRGLYDPRDLLIELRSLEPAQSRRGG